MAPLLSPSCGNQLLARLTRGEYLRLLPRLQPVSLKFRQVLSGPWAPAAYAYFPTRCALSTVLLMRDGDAIEVTAVGSEGVVGWTGFAAATLPSSQVMVQLAGEALRIRREVLEEEASRDGPLRRLLLDYRAAFLAQLTQGVACNGLHTIEQRCCRWLLEARDRLRADVLPVTHEFLAMLLGVRRASVSQILEALQESGLIRSERGKITVLQRDGLKSVSCECYQAVRGEFNRLFGRSPDSLQGAAAGLAGGTRGSCATASAC